MNDDKIYDSVYTQALNECFKPAKGYCPTMRYVRYELSKWLNAHPMFIEAFDCDVIDEFIPIVAVNDICKPKNLKFLKFLAEHEHPLMRFADGGVGVRDLIGAEDFK